MIQECIMSNTDPRRNAPRIERVDAEEDHQVYPQPILLQTPVHGAMQELHHAEICVRQGPQWTKWKEACGSYFLLSKTPNPWTLNYSLPSEIVQLDPVCKKRHDKQYSIVLLKLNGANQFENFQTLIRTKIREFSKRGSKLEISVTKILTSNR